MSPATSSGPAEAGAHPDDPAAEAERRRAVRAAVTAFVPVDARAVASRARVLAELGHLAHPFDRHADLVHVTGSAVVTGARGTVLHRHKRLGRWLQPGGHLEPGEAPAEAARREAAEETGLAVSHPGPVPHLLHVDVHAAADAHVHLDLRYLLVADDPGARPAPAPGESQAAAWFMWADALALADDSLRGALAAAMTAAAGATS